MLLRNRTDISACSLAVINLLAGIGLLMLSAWFIAAAALAGMSATAFSFNYVIPSAAIRLLAFIRILSGYGEKYVGHDSLLKLLNAIRLSVYQQVMWSDTTEPKAKEMDTLVTDTEALANQQLAVINPNIALLILLVGVLLTFWLLIPQQLLLLAILIMLAGLLLFIQFQRIHLAQTGFSEAQFTYRDSLTQFLESPAIWSLQTQTENYLSHQARWQAAVLRLADLQQRSEWWLLLLSYAAVLGVLIVLPRELLANPIVVCLPLLMLALPEWFGHSIRSLQPYAEALTAKKRLSSYSVGEAHSAQTEPAVPIDSSIAPVQTFQLKDFTWLRGSQRGKKINLSLAYGDVLWLRGSSGSGKSSLLMALSGLLDHSGRLILNNQVFSQQALQRISPNTLVYSEQFPYVLSDTLRQNLLLANPAASDSQLKTALGFTGLTNLVDALDQWLGPQGRHLSGGEQKRLGIARAYLSGAPIWCLDEPFAALDKATADKLAQRLLSDRGSRICILASHRLPQCLAREESINVIALEDFR